MGRDEFVVVGRGWDVGVGVGGECTLCTNELPGSLALVSLCASVTCTHLSDMCFKLLTTVRVWQPLLGTH